MRSRRLACVVLAVAAVLAACSSSGRAVSDGFGHCRFVPHTVCRDQNLDAVAAPSVDLTGADLSGARLRGADLRDVSLRGAELVGADLGDADLSGADLQQADMTDARLVGSSFAGADWFGSVRTGAVLCNTVLPDGTVSDCPQSKSSETTPAPPPQVVRARPSKPVVCIVDGIGDGIDVDDATRNARSVVFEVDGERVSDATASRGTHRIPFPCDGHAHVVTVVAFGPTPPPAQQSFPVKVGEGTPAPLVR
jgi:hypothetical protein